MRETKGEGDFTPGRGPTRLELAAIAVVFLLAAAAQLSSLPEKIEAAGGRVVVAPAKR